MPNRREDSPPPGDDDAPTIGLGGAAAGTPGPAALAPGDVLSGRFRILAFLGRGGMGEVYEAEDLELGERVAVKTIRGDIAADERIMERFKREVHLARRVTHPNVCRLFDLERHQGAGRDVAFLSMELLRGETLADRLRRGRPAPEETARLAHQLAEALAAAHRAGIVHRDFKPGNVILTQPPNARAVVTDFGLAARSGDEGARGEAVTGTLAYMAPEQREGDRASAASDVYSFGLVLLEMITGLSGQDAWEVLPPADRERWGPVLARCLARDPAQRFPSALELSEAMHRLQARPARARRAAGWAAAGALAVAAAAALAWSALRQHPDARSGLPPAALAAPVQITTSPSLDIHPSFSPDGRWLAYSSDHGGSFQVYLRRLPPGTEEKRLTNGGDNFQPAWSPDGRAIAYHAKGGGLWIVPAEGGPARQLTRFGSHPAWSPDGTRLAFQSEPLGDLGANAWPALPPCTLWTVSRDGGQPLQLTRPGVPTGGHGAPSWSPDGRRIVFGTADRRLAEIWTVASDGSDPVRLVHDEGYAFDPVYSVDGGTVFYSSYSRYLYGIWSAPISPEGRPRGPAVEIASLGLPRLRHLAVSRDGRRIAYSSLTLASNLWSLPLSRGGAAAGAPRALTRGTGKLGRPAISPDGRWVAYDRAQSGLPEQLWVGSADGGEERAITSDPVEHNLPGWFPGGDRLSYMRKERDRFAIWSVALDGSEHRALVDLRQEFDWPRLSPDGRRVAFNSREGVGAVNTWVAAVADGAARQLTWDAELAGFPSWSPDGRTLAVEVKRGDHTHVGIVPSGGGPLVQLTSDEGQSWPFSFSPDGDRIAFAGQRAGLWNVWTVSLSTRRQQRLTSNDRLNVYIRTPFWSPRGDRIVYEYGETTGNVWMIELAR